MKNKEDTIFIVFILCVLGIIFTIIGIVGYEIKQMIIDHKCYEMSDEEFYSNEMCKEYWEDRNANR